MNEDVTTQGQNEPFKGSIHLVLFGLAVAAGLYNCAAYQRRPCNRLICNSVLYAGLAAFEAKQMLSHFIR